MQSYSNSSQDYSADNAFDYGRRQPERLQNRTRRSAMKRSSKSSAAFNGVHRRRNKHWSW